MTHHFLSLSRRNKDELRAILELAKLVKGKMKAGKDQGSLKGKQLAMIFEKPSTRTRVSFEAGINQLGGGAIILDAASSQLGRGETVADTARVLSRYVDIMMIRCNKHETLLELAEYSSVPVINGLTDYDHPCQIMADIMTYEQHKGPICGKKIVWVGDGNNVCNSWIHAAAIMEFDLHIATPEQFKPSDKIMNWAKEHNANIHLTTDPKEAVTDADCVNADTWVSMGDENADERRKVLEPYQVNDELMALAKSDAVFMHCLPAHRGEEVTDSVIDGEQSIVFDEAENRMHVQKGIMLWCLDKEIH